MSFRNIRSAARKVTKITKMTQRMTKSLLFFAFFPPSLDIDDRTEIAEVVNAFVLLALRPIEDVVEGIPTPGARACCAVSVLGFDVVRRS